jgi:hypothetical protein
VFRYSLRIALFLDTVQEREKVLPVLRVPIDPGLSEIFRSQIVGESRFTVRIGDLILGVVRFGSNVARQFLQIVQRERIDRRLASSGHEAQRGGEFVVGEGVLENQLAFPALSVRGTFWPGSTGFRMRSWRNRTQSGLAMFFPWIALGLKQLPDTGKTQQFRCAQHGVGQPRFFFVPVLDLGPGRSQKLGALQVVEIGANLLDGKQPPNCGDKGRQLRSEVGVLLRCRHEREQLLPDQIVQRVVRPEALADVFGGGRTVQSISCGIPSIGCS